MNERIKKALLGGRLVLLLGAGASRSSKDRHGKVLLDGWGLAKRLAEEAGLAFKDEALPIVYSASKKPLGQRLNILLEGWFKHTRPSPAYDALSKYPWARIYTLNIDDALEKALRKNSPQNINIRNRFDRIVDRAPFFDDLDLVKLNGNIDRIEDGLIFSPQEYGAASAHPPLWYEELARDFFRYTFLFVGTKLSEPLFFHQIERFRQTTSSVEGESYVLTPSASEIEVGSLADLNLKHIPGTLEEFVAWLGKEIPSPPSPFDVAKKYHPQIDYLATKNSKKNYLELFESVVRVGRTDLASHLRPPRPPHKIRDFYRGFKPTWNEILSDVPAKLRVVKTAGRRLISASPDEKLFVIFGPAGSGKTTALMQTALAVADSTDRPVYLLSDVIKNTRELLYALEETSEGPYYIFVDRLKNVEYNVDEVLRSGKFVNGIVVASERQSIWHSKTSVTFEGIVAGTFPVDVINEREADDILKKLEQFGPWHRLARMQPKARRDELLKKAHRQLLIGLLETTEGAGFDQIIQKDFADLGSQDAKWFVILVGFATMHQQKMPEPVLSRALKHLGILDGTSKLAKVTSGIVRVSGSSYTARHPIYVERLFELSVSKQQKSDALHAILNAFTAYERPLMKNLSKPAQNIFKLNINHNFLKNIFLGDIELVLNVYESFSKAFQEDGLFWLQFGLALRDAGFNDQALEKLRTARGTHRLRQADHAYAQQLLIMAGRGDSKIIGLAYLQEAKTILEELDLVGAELDGDEADYPIVTLSEEHTNLSIKFEGIERGREVAKLYANILYERHKENPGNVRLKQAWKMLTGFSTGGAWK
ncbi:hypothetical protein ABIC89_000414 [Variovorax boronicumulans]|uniref:P-loop NTPase n=1 Tax=Variovorax boronicumulans TaxID=436515 RepID=UPI003390D2E1